MRHKLEMVTASHSVRSTTKPEKPSLSQVSENVPKKLEDNRRLLLEQQLGTFAVTFYFEVVKGKSVIVEW